MSIINKDLKYMLHFSQALCYSKELIKGRLALIDLRDFRVLDRWIASSGSPGRQIRNDIYKKGGSIPRQDMARIDKWWVETTGLPESNLDGIQGQFFQIYPRRVTLSEGVKRSEFGIHLDANEGYSPGSLGCIVMSDKRKFQKFINHMEIIRNDGFKNIPLLIEYVD